MKLVWSLPEGFAAAVALALLVDLAPGVLAQGQPPDASAPLRASIKLAIPADELAGAAVLGADGRSITLSVVNHGQRALAVNGDKVVVQSGAAKQIARAEKKIIGDPAKANVPADLVGAGVSIATHGIAPVVADAEGRRQTPASLYYGKDGKRRDLAGKRFGARLVLAGASSQGRVYLSRAVKLPAVLSIPVTNQADGSDLGVLEINVSK